MFKTNKEIRDNRMERKVIDACVNNDWDRIRHWIKCGYISRDYAMHILTRVRKGWGGGYGKNAKTVPAWGGNPCSEIPLGEPQEGARFKHPTARVNRKHLLIG